MKFYIATRLERIEEQKALSIALAELGHVITYDWSAHGSVQSEGPDRIREVAEAEAAGVLRSDLFVALLPGGRGTHTELGIAIADSMARNPTGNRVGGEKRIVIVGNDADLGDCGRMCCFYFHPAIDARFATIPEFVGFMRGLKAAGGEWR